MPDAPSHPGPARASRLVAASACLEPLRGARAPEAVRLLARAYETNPLHVRALGGVHRARNAAFFAGALRVLRGPTLVALADDRVVGLVHWAESPACLPPAAARARLLPTLLAALGVPAAVRVARWLASWAAHDLREPHLHLGPIAVEPALQGSGVGRRLMDRFCAAQDGRGVAGYLETDRVENVAFYRRFGFGVLGELPVLGVRTWRMRRPATVRPPGGPS